MSLIYDLGKDSLSLPFNIGNQELQSYWKVECAIYTNAYPIVSKFLM
jgi:hypothetical protein